MNKEHRPNRKQRRAFDKQLRASRRGPNFTQKGRKRTTLDEKIKLWSKEQNKNYLNWVAFTTAWKTKHSG